MRKGSVNWREVTALYGGTYNPPHSGHLHVARQLLRHPGVKRVVIVPSGIAPLKPHVIAAEHRYKMAKLLFEPEFEVSDFEVRETQTPSYTWNTIQHFRKLTPNLAFVVGDDQVPHFHKWYRFPDILDLCHWIILSRNGNPFPNQIPATSGTQIQTIEGEFLPWSSTQIRESIARTGTPPLGSLTPGVERYLMDHGLYGTSTKNR